MFTMWWDSVLGPVVSFRQEGFEHLTPTRFAKMSSVCLEKSSRAMLILSLPNDLALSGQ